MTAPDVVAAVEAVRALVQADGGDVELVGVDDATMRVRLVLERAGCAECVMPRPFLEKVALDVVRARAPWIVAVDVDDPRER